MYNSIIQFIEKDTKKIEKLMPEHLLSENMLRFEEGLMDTIIEFVRKLYQEVLESIEKTIRDSTEDTRELIYEAIGSKDLRETERFLRKCAASAITEGKQKSARVIWENMLNYRK